MHVDVRGAAVDAALHAHTRARLGAALARFGRWVARVAVRYSHSPRGPDTRCRIILHTDGFGSLVVDGVGRHPAGALALASDRAARATERARIRRTTRRARPARSRRLPGS